MYKTNQKCNQDKINNVSASITNDKIEVAI